MLRDLLTLGYMSVLFVQIIWIWVRIIVGEFIIPSEETILKMDGKVKALKRDTSSRLS